MKIKKILIANRGEIAIRIIRTCREMGIKTIALCPEKGQEFNFLETNLADETAYLEEEGAAGYLNPKKIVAIAKSRKADAIHPGYGFLAENWNFARICEKNRIKFIGPKSEVLRKFEDKVEAKKIAKKVGIPTLPASDQSIRSKKDLAKWIKKIQPPFILKARKGGGGIGIKVIDKDNMSFGSLFSCCMDIKRQMALAFSETDFFLEKYLREPRHIEFQILGDGEKVIHLGERECSIQRRNQKLFEEAPSCFLTEKEREKLGALSVELGECLKYKGAATVEFLMDKDRNFYFLEVNPRIQVEHPVTEAVTGIDIVEQQIRIAEGEPLSFLQEDIQFNGWAVEARINCEDPEDNFRPKTGTVEEYIVPGGQQVFLHSFVRQGQEVFPYFDSLLSKVIAWGKTRDEAVNRLIRALDEYAIKGVPTTTPFFKFLLKDKDFLKGDFSTNFIEKKQVSKELGKMKAMEEINLCSPLQIKEEDIAKLLFDVYKELKKDLKVEDESGRSEPSKWVMAERLKMLRD